MHLYMVSKTILVELMSHLIYQESQEAAECALSYF